MNENKNVQQQLADNIYLGVGYALDSWRNTTVWFSNIPFVQKIIVVVLIMFFFLSIIYSIYAYVKNKAATEFENAPSFITDLKKLPDTKKEYSYQYSNGSRVNYLPSHLFPTKNSREFTWTFWIYINGFDPKGKGDDWSYKYGQYKHIMSHGSSDVKVDGYQYPGFWIKPNSNTLACYLYTDKGLVELDYKDFPMNEWTHVSLVLSDNTLALYINGGLEISQVLPGSPLYKNGKNVYLFANGGFAGGFYYLQYFNNALDSAKIRELYKDQQGALQTFMHNQEYKLLVSKQVSTTNVSKGLMDGTISPSETKSIKSDFSSKSLKSDLSNVHSEAKSLFSLKGI